MSTSIKLTSSDLLQEVLIVEVEKYEHLYNPKAMDKDFNSCESSWQEISSTVNLTVPETKRLWYNLRERYMNERGKHSKSDWHLYDVIDFLEPHIKRGQADTNESLTGKGFIMDSDDDDVNTPSTSLAIGRTHYSLKAKTNGITKLKKETRLSSRKQDNETTIFLDFVGKQLDRLPVPERSSCYLEIMQVLNKYTQESAR
uniref:Myb/SANT-like DNA-binding domain-containing protein 4 n=1 Tax=Phallusia mammillata TaxID=59560 RepID=A0A6F9DKQ9_9ASCI|nr:myb/SANT-like DNA-binding domain-containing protein 4 [Phallusia mammillata]